MSNRESESRAADKGQRFRFSRASLLSSAAAHVWY
jgi:hypothetical protein